MAVCSLALGPMAAAEQPWYHHRSSVDLHPVRQQLWLSWQRHTHVVMAGPRASPLFRDDTARMEVLWRLAAVDGQAPALTPDETQRVFDLALVGATMGLGSTVDEMARRSEGLDSAVRLARAATGPGIRIQRSDQPSGGVDIGLEEGRSHGRAARAHIAEPPSPMARRGPPGVHFGQGFRIEERTDDEGRRYLPAAVAHLELRRVGVDVLRLEDSVIYESPEVLVHDWVVLARQQLKPGLTLHGEIRGEGRTPYPDRVRGSVAVRHASLRQWSLRPGVSQTLARPDRDNEVALRWEVQLRWVTRWRLPVAVDQWPLDHEIGQPGRPLPTIADHGPHQLTDPLRPNLVRATESPARYSAR